MNRYNRDFSRAYSSRTPYEFMGDNNGFSYGQFFSRFFSPDGWKEIGWKRFEQRSHSAVINTFEWKTVVIVTHAGSVVRNN